MKFGVMKSDVNVTNETAENFLCYYTKGAFKREGIRILDKCPEYEYLREDPFLYYDPWDKDKRFNENEFYRSVLFTYMTDQILKQNPSLNEKYKEIVQEEKDNWRNSHSTDIVDNINKIYSCFNGQFIKWYAADLREQADPGVLEREAKQHEEERKRIQADHNARKRQEQQQLQQDLAAGTRVICPYCKSADTKKISALSRAASVSLVGAASGKIGKQWHCNHCGSDF